MAKVARRERRVEWSQLLPELLNRISRNLTNIVDYIRFRAVCSTWRSAASPAELPPQYPWLMATKVPNYSGARSFLNFSDNKVYVLELPELRHKAIHGTPHGWLVLIGKYAKQLTVSLLNPMTKAQFALPSLPLAWRPPFHKAVLTSSPSLPRTRPVLVAVWIDAKLAICTLGEDKTWTMIDVSRFDSGGDLAYYEGAFYFINGLGSGGVLHPGSSMFSLEPLPHERYESVHFVPSDLDIFIVARAKNRDIVDFWKLDRSRQPPKWVRVEAVGGNTCFIGNKYMRAMHNWEDCRFPWMIPSLR